MFCSVSSRAQEDLAHQRQRQMATSWTELEQKARERSSARQNDPVTGKLLLQPQRDGPDAPVDGQHAADLLRGSESTVSLLLWPWGEEGEGGSLARLDALFVVDGYLSIFRLC